MGNGARGEKPELGPCDRRKRTDEGWGKVQKGRAGGRKKDAADEKIQVEGAADEKAGGEADRKGGGCI